MTEMAALQREVGEIKVIVSRIDKTLFGENGDDGRCAVHAKRLSRLELWRAWITGALAALGLVETTAIAIAAAKMHGG